MIYIACIAILFAIAAGTGLHNTTINLRNSLSIHVGKSRRSIVVARMCFLLISALLLLWFFTQYMDKYGTSIDIMIGMILFATTIALQGVFPYGQKKSWNTVHDIAAWSAAFVGPMLLLRFAWASGSVAQLLLSVCGILSVAILASLFLIPPARKYFLILQLSMVMISGASFLILAI